jgi:uncharacterized cofD-like protein
VNLRRWLQPGIGVKRWLLVVFIGELGLALAGAFLLRSFYRDLEVGGPLQVALSVMTLQFLPYAARGVILAGLGLALFLFGSYRLVRALMDPFRRADADQPLVEVIYQKRFLSRGPRIVAIGGGTGLSTLLRGLKEHTSNLTAVVTVADDGGSSGALRRILGVPAVGDIRNCIVALADAEPLMGELLQYRFPEPAVAADAPTGEVVLDGLGGHAVGNLLIAAMAAIRGGDFEDGVRQVNRVLAVRGRVLPVSPTPVTLHARCADGTELIGQSRITRTSGIESVWLTPTDLTAASDALEAIADADVIVLGPGSLFTSILPTLLVPGVAEAVRDARAVRVHVCNVATQPGETSGFDLADHVEALERHLGPGMVDVVLAHNEPIPQLPGSRSEPVRLRWPPSEGEAPRLVLEDVASVETPHHHDAANLARAILRIAEAEARRRGGAGAARTA